MPIFEYQCVKCGRVLSFLVRSLARHQSPACPKCGHPAMTRVLSRFAAPGTAKRKASGSPPDSNTGPDIPPGMERLFAQADGIDENDPRAMGRFMRQMARETGEPLPDGMEEYMRRLESGEDPGKIEEPMDGLLDAPSGPGGSRDSLYDA